MKKRHTSGNAGGLTIRACPECGEDWAEPARADALDVELVAQCPACGAVSVYGRWKESDPWALCTVVSSGSNIGTGPGDWLAWARESAEALRSPGMSETAQPKLPLLWAPSHTRYDLHLGGDILIGRLTGNAACRCCNCDRRLVVINWHGRAGEGRIAGVVVIDTLLRARRRDFARLDQRLRGLGYAAAILACRACRLENVFVLKGHRAARKLALSEIEAHT